MKINCPVCKLSKTCHIVWKRITEYQSEYWTDVVTKAKLQVHKHRKGSSLCKGSGRKIIVKSLEDARIQLIYQYHP